ncbi:permease-like cell division protein FtsX [Zooshikella sp. RANM57]|uniref:permease-like cell division protein FtsX n=1 Tax=Zooshikella sp. RANM57 TaxID=3425863 RepID=UPI003D6EDACD
MTNNVRENYRSKSGKLAKSNMSSSGRPAASVNQENQPRKSAQRTHRSSEFSLFLLHHQQMMWQSLQRLLKAPVASFMTALMIAVALSLPAMLYLLIENAQTLSSRWDGAPQISLFFTLETPSSNVAEVFEQLQQDQRFSNVELITPEQALSEFEQQGGFKGVLQHLSANPLPATIVLQPKQIDGVYHQQAIAQTLEQIKGVEQVQFDTAWIARLNAMLQLGQRAGAMLAGLFALAVILVIANTVRLAIESRREEIVVVKLVGATNAYVRRPFLYMGLWFGVLGGLLALVLVHCLIWLLTDPVADLSQLYETHFEIAAMTMDASLLLVVTSGGLGWIGAWFTCQRQLRMIEPR